MASDEVNALKDIAGKINDLGEVMRCSLAQPTRTLCMTPKQTAEMGKAAKVKEGTRMLALIPAEPTRRPLVEVMASSAVRLLDLPLPTLSAQLAK